MAIIELNYQDTINKSEQLIELTSDIKSICRNDIEAIKNTCNSVWKGDAGVEYQKKLSQIQSKIEKRSRSIESTADSLGKTARRLKRAEEAANAIFNKIK